MTEVLLSLGSNINREHNIRSGLNALKAEYGTLEISPVYESEAVGFDGDNFYNLIVAIETNASLSKLSKTLKHIESLHGRDRASPKFSSRTLDIDILTYDVLCGIYSGIQLPRDEILKNAFVLLPLSDLRPEGRCPGTQRRYLELWQAFDQESQKLWQVGFIEKEKLAQ
ncbi:2-amino-4-hydroxy-6-hydroxymethyldihydropteridine diphosphokinase [Teredinibacter haidensis]|uniref:2-amino-4-hydroxy-6- hydroxymethyldihydropteridine diphosphokinase n=1 Tax=Teredinibacter haidensis TaxID=2731755 RepID=UPI000948DCE0|nr:2-amino-4-hydroxy-6-hydroxymethyldihydropteridine diphosphokinase [Teredinibacter haidensis]